MSGRAWESFTAIGDSFTEGLDDRLPDGTFRGWADLVAQRLAGQLPPAGPPFRYANLAVRGRLLEPIIRDQVPRAIAMKPGLVSLAGGGNDVLRPRVALADLRDLLSAGVERLSDAGSTVMVFTGVLAAGGLPAAAAMRRRVEAYNDVIRQVAADHGAVLADLAADSAFTNVRYFSTDRLHFSALGHQRVAAIALRALEVAPEEEWFASQPDIPRIRWSAARREDLRWARTHLVPWIGRRIAGRSSGDTVVEKRPDLLPW